MDYKGYQVYFQESGKISIFRDNELLVLPAETFLGSYQVYENPKQAEPGKDAKDRKVKKIMTNYSKGVQLVDKSLFFICGKGCLARFDMPVLIRQAEHRRGYRADILPSSYIVDFYATGRDRVHCISDNGILTLIEHYRVVKQTKPLSKTDTFSCIIEIGGRLAISSYNEESKINMLRLHNGADLKEFDSHIIHNEVSPVGCLKAFKKRDLVHLLVVNEIANLHLFMVFGMRLVPAILKYPIDQGNYKSSRQLHLLRLCHQRQLNSGGLWSDGRTQETQT